MSDERPLAISHRRFLGITGPLILSNLTAPLLGMVDTAIVGHLPLASALSATAVGGSVMAALLWLAGFLRMGATAVVARHQDAAQARSQLSAGLRLGAVTVVLIWLAAWPIVWSTVAASGVTADVKP